jgi:hypothetical protein
MERRWRTGRKPTYQALLHVPEPAKPSPRTSHRIGALFEVPNGRHRRHRRRVIASKLIHAVIDHALMRVIVRAEEAVSPRSIPLPPDKVLRLVIVSWHARHVIPRTRGVRPEERRLDSWAPRSMTVRLEFLVLPLDAQERRSAAAGYTGECTGRYSPFVARSWSEQSERYSGGAAGQWIPYRVELM